MMAHSVTNHNISKCEMSKNGDVFQPKQEEKIKCDFLALSLSKNKSKINIPKLAPLISKKKFLLKV